MCQVGWSGRCSRLGLHMYMNVSGVMLSQGGMNESSMPLPRTYTGYSVGIATRCT